MTDYPSHDAYRAHAAMQKLVLQQRDVRGAVEEATGISFGRARALRRLVYGPLRMSELAARLGWDKPYTTTVVDDLEERGLVTRNVVPDDRRAKMVETIEKTRGIQAAELARIEARRQETIERRTLLDDKIATMVEAINLRGTILERKKGLADRKLGTVDQSEQVELGLLDQRTQLSGLRLDRATLTQELNGLDNDLAVKPLQHRNEISGLQRDLSSLDQQLAESETRRENVIVAPESGVLSVDLATLGQSVIPSQALAVIQPDGTALQVHLFAPSRAVGFVKPDDRVNLRYQAFPYQKFGQQEGRVSSIARIALSSTELASLNLPQQDQNEPLYRIVVEPRRQAIEVYGHQTPLQAGMSVDAYVLQETRAIYEWMIEPLLSVNSMSHGASHAP